MNFWIIKILFNQRFLSLKYIQSYNQDLSRVVWRYRVSGFIKQVNGKIFLGITISIILIPAVYSDFRSQLQWSAWSVSVGKIWYTHIWSVSSSWEIIWNYLKVNSVSFLPSCESVHRYYLWYVIFIVSAFRNKIFHENMKPLINASFLTARNYILRSK